MSMTLENGVLMPSLVSLFSDLKEISFLKTLLCTNVLNDVTAAPFLVIFLQLAA